MEELDLMALDFSSIDDIIDNNPLELLEKAAKASEEKEMESVREKTEKYIVELDALTPNNKPKESVKTEVKKEELNTASINTTEVSDEYGAVGSPGKVFVPGAKRQTKAKTATKAPTKKDVPTKELQEAEIATFLDGVKNPFIEDVTVNQKTKQATIDDLFEDIIIETSKAKAETKEAMIEVTKVEEVKVEKPVSKEEPKVELKAEVKEEPKAEEPIAKVEEAKVEEKPKKTTRKRQTKKETVKEEEVDEILSEEDIKELRTTLRQIVRKELRLAIKDAFKDLSEEF
jgi:probable serine/threonine-protein kinase kinX